MKPPRMRAGRKRRVDPPFTGTEKIYIVSVLMVIFFWTVLWFGLAVLCATINSPGGAICLVGVCMFVWGGCIFWALAWWWSEAGESWWNNRKPYEDRTQRSTW